MGIIKKKSKQSRLLLKVKVIQARNVTIENSGCNPICLATTNGVFTKTNKQKNTTSPTWNQVLKLRLPDRPYSEHLRIVIYDVLTSTFGENGVEENGHKDANAYDTSRKYLYLGEVQVSLLELFRKRDNPTSYKFSSGPSWYRLYNRNAIKYAHAKLEHAPTSLAVGEVQLAFSLDCPKGQTLFKAFNDWQMTLVEDLERLKKQRSSSRSRSNLDLLSTAVADAASVISDVSSDATDFEDIVEVPSLEETETTANTELVSLKYLYEQFGELLDDEDDDEAEEDFEEEDENDIEDIEDINDDDDDFADFDDVTTNLHLNKVATALDEYDVVLSTSNLSLDPSTNPTSQLTNDDIIYEYSDESDGKESQLMMLMQNNRKPRRRGRHRNGMKFQLSKREHAAGVIFLDIEKIINLPALRNKFSKRYLMDPFVIITFGRRVYKTSWRKHSLNPVYNERIAFEIFSNETNFDFHFKVVDKDSFSYHDNVAEASISWSELDNMQHENGEGYAIPLTLNLKLNDDLHSDDYSPQLFAKFSFVSYKNLKKHFWERVINYMSTLKEFDIVELSLFMDQIGTFADDEIMNCFYYAGKSPWAYDKVTREEVVEYLQLLKSSAGFKKIKKCPLCFRRYKSTRNAVNSKLTMDNDLITHFAICSARDNKKKLLKPSYVSSDFASKRWFSKFLIKLTYGRYALGSNNANILVQDRDTGVVIEEKISAHVKLGIRIIYNGKGTQSKKFKALLKKQSIKQGKKFDSSRSVKEIDSFIKFHSLDTSECVETEYKTFNEFFYRKLKPGSREPEVESPKVLLSPADSRCTVFSSIKSSKQIWIKGRNFTLTKLTGNYRPEVFNDRSCSIGIFRLAPQDYHRFHCPCDGIIGKPKYISGEYYTVNPMAIRTELDVFGENVRVVIPIESEHFGTILYIPVGAMMVGSVILTCNEGDKVERGQELGYFKFGGSTVLLIIPSQKIEFDTDLLKNSEERIETLVKVGMSVGHTPDVKEHKREKIIIRSKEELDRITRTITVTDDTAKSVSNVSWEYQTLQKLASHNISSSTPVSSDPTDTGFTELISISSD
ncbi:LAFE_0E13432g1_1 [Lachancea fermentati]|uniref:Phosphatidylserine decarboxylase proenzyme 2 n=1 Tax=Lachancea fermentati TaxID=4955 RepID=A0A1G4MDY4_LACFM|nr:LAFE_0E13432g1_1 [Lachancea fermentati]